MFMYFLLPHWVPATWRNLAQASISAEFPYFEDFFSKPYINPFGLLSVIT